MMHQAGRAQGSVPILVHILLHVHPCSIRPCTHTHAQHWYTAFTCIHTDRHTHMHIRNTKPDHTGFVYVQKQGYIQLGTEEATLASTAALSLSPSLDHSPLPPPLCVPLSLFPSLTPCLILPHLFLSFPLLTAAATLVSAVARRGTETISTVRERMPGTMQCQRHFSCCLRDTYLTTAREWMPGTTRSSPSAGRPYTCMWLSWTSTYLYTYVCKFTLKHPESCARVRVCAHTHAGA